MAEDHSDSLQLDDISQDNIFPTGNSGDLHSGLLDSAPEEEYLLHTPEQKLGSQKGGPHDHISETFLSSDSGSSDISAKEASEYMSSSSSSSDAESGTYTLPIKKYLLQHVNGGEVLQSKFTESEVDTFDMQDNIPIVKENGKEGTHKEKDMYEDLLLKVTNYEAELKLANKKLHSSQEEVARLKYENLTLVEELGRTIENLRTSEENMKKMELKFRDDFQDGQEQLQGKLDMANESVTLLQAELTSERTLGYELQEMITKTTQDLSDYCREVEELKLALHDAQKDFSKDKSQFQSDIKCLHEENNVLQTRINEAEMRNKVLEEQIRQYEVDKMEIGKLHIAQETSLLEQIRQLNTELSLRNEQVDTLNHSLDASKQKYDMLMAEKNEIFAKLQTLNTEVSCQDTNIRQMEELVRKLTVAHMELVAEAEKTQKLAEELTLKVRDQEKELEKQQVTISNRAEEKLEAIRQLCFSLEYYRNEYHELRQAFLKHKKPAVLAS